MRLETGKSKSYLRGLVSEKEALEWLQRNHLQTFFRSDIEEGGEIIFPAAIGNFSETPGWSEKSECAKRGLAVKQKMGDALLFWSMRPDATLDLTRLHGGCPVIKGNKMVIYKVDVCW